MHPLLAFVLLIYYNFMLSSLFSTKFNHFCHNSLTIILDKKNNLIASVSTAMAVKVATLVTTEVDTTVVTTLLRSTSGEKTKAQRYYMVS